MGGSATRAEAALGSAGSSDHARLVMMSEGILSPPAVVYGMQSAVNGFVRAVFTERVVGGCDLYAPAPSLASARAQMAALTGLAGRSGESVWPLEALRERFAASPPLALHEPSGELWRLHYLRAHVAPGAYPITAAHHSVSYAPYRYLAILPLLMARCRPYDALVCPGQTARRALQALIGHVREALAVEYNFDLPYGGRMEVIPYGVDTEVFKPRDRQEARCQLALPPDPVTVLALGRFSATDKMDLAPLLLVFRDLVRVSRQDLLLVLGGSDPEGHAGAVEALVREMGLQGQVRVLTNLPRFVPPLLYAAADVFVSVSDNMQEMFGQTPVEAMSVGLPVVVSDWNGYRDTVVHGECGFRVPTTWAPCDADICTFAPVGNPRHDHLLLAQTVAVDCGQLFECLRRLVSNRELREGLGERARRHVLAEFAWGAVMTRYVALWTELGSRARAQSLPAASSLSFMRPDYTGTFGPFATRLLTPGARLWLTARGGRVLRGKERLELSQTQSHYFARAALVGVLAMLRVAGRLRMPVTAVGALRWLSERHGLVETAGYRHLLRLLKYDLIALDCRNGARDTGPEREGPRPHAPPAG